MNSCACKGIRTCKICEVNKIVTSVSPTTTVDLSPQLNKTEVWDESTGLKILKYSLPNLVDITDIYSELANKLDINENEIEINLDKSFDGFYVIENFFKDKSEIIQMIQLNEWKESQSGRKKQDFGPKINYKKMKVKPNEDYKNSSFYKYVSESIISKLMKLDFLSSFQIEGIGNLFYSPSSGAHIDPHIDDIWIWGKRIIGINLLSDTVMTFSLTSDHELAYELNIPIKDGDIYIMTNHARYIWKHGIKKEEVIKDRIAVTMREYERKYSSNL